MQENPHYWSSFFVYILFSLGVIGLAYFTVRMAVRDGVNQAIKKLKEDNIIKPQ